jgi:hypothetical protein
VNIPPNISCKTRIFNSVKFISFLSLALAAGVYAETIPAGTIIPVRTVDTIDAHDSGTGRVYAGVVSSDVLDTDAPVAIPRGSDVEMMVRDIGHHEISLDLDAIVVNGRRYGVATYDVTESGGRKDGIGANGRTGKFIGGGALFGTIIGAVAGGGKGAGIGALAGGSAGAIGQVATRGKRVRVPSESVLTFQLRAPLALAGDLGYSRDGRHYHPEK